MIGHNRKQAIKYIAGALVVLGAFSIMAPGLTSYVFGLWRLLTLLVTMVIAAWLIVYIWHKLRAKRKEPEDSNEQ